MKLWLISQSENNGYDTFDSAVVAAETEEEARLIYPGDWNDNKFWSNNEWKGRTVNGNIYSDSGSCWTSPDRVNVQFLADGYEGEAGSICSSFNAG
jgi:hypothetical protein